MEDVDLVQPGIDIKPIINFEDIKQIVSNNYGFKVLKITELNGYDDKNYHVILEDIEQKCNQIYDLSGEGYVLKIVNSLDSKKPKLFEAQNSLLLHLKKKGIICSQPVPTKHGLYFAKINLTSGEHIIRLLEFISGCILQKVPCTASLCLQVGEYVAKLDQALKDFHHPAYDTYKSLWSLQSIPELRKFVFAVTDETRKKIVLEVITEFETKVLPTVNSFEKGLIHGDFNEQNILVEEISKEWKIKAAIDFGDAHIAPYLFEIAISMTYMILEANDMESGGHVFAGYSRVRTVPDVEFRLLKICIAARLCQSLVMGAYTNLKQPENSYVLTTSVKGWTLLEKIWMEPENELLQRWKSVSNTEKCIFKKAMIKDVIDSR